MSKPFRIKFKKTVTFSLNGKLVRTYNEGEEEDASAEDDNFYIIDLGKIFHCEAEKI